MFGKIMGLIAIIAGAFGTLLAFEIISLNTVDPGEMDLWHQRFGKIIKIVGPVFIVVGILFLFVIF